jgi:tetratricopeptide (TPR) repeat protein
VRYRLARILEEQGKLAAAAAAYEHVAADSPLRRRAADRAAACLTKILRGAWAKNESVEGEAGLIAKARALLAETAAPLPEAARKERGGKEANAIAAAACVRLARLLLNDRVNETESAIKLLKDFAEKYPGQGEALGDALFVEAWALGKAGQLDKGLAKLREARAAFPASDRAGPAAVTLALGLEKRAQSQKGNAAAASRTKAAELFKLALASPGCGEEDSVQMWLHLAELYVDVGDWKQAKAAYLGLHKRYPDALNVHEGLARCYTGLSDFKNALTEWRLIERTAEPASERWWEAKYMIVSMHYRMRNYKEALKIIRVTKALRPSLGGPELSKKFLEIEKRCK